MTPKRKLKSFLVTPEQFTLAMKAAGIPLPEDATFFMGGWDADHGAFRVAYYSAAFDEVPIEKPIPLSLNGPMLSEAQ